MRWLVKGVAVVGLALGLGACRQGLGDRCQIDSDCQDGLFCSSAGTFPTCRQRSASLPDASTVDGPIPDARLTSSPDSQVQSVDARTFDAKTHD
jgi:hypothetical protein